MWFEVASVAGLIGGFAQLLKAGTPIRGILIALPALLCATTVAMFPRTDAGLRSTLGVMLTGAFVSFVASVVAWLGGWAALGARGQRRAPFRGLYVLLPPSLTLVVYLAALFVRGLLG